MYADRRNLKDGEKKIERQKGIEIKLPSAGTRKLMRSSRYTRERAKRRARAVELPAKVQYIRFEYDLVGIFSICLTRVDFPLVSTRDAHRNDVLSSSTLPTH